MLPLCDRPGGPALLLAALVVIGAFAIFPFGCDAEYVVFDPVWYAAGAEQGVAADTVKAHHPLFHLLAAAIAKPLELVGVLRPGHVGTRLLSGAGAATILLLLVGLAGRQRWRVGAGLALFLLAGRTWFLEAFTGENVLPAIAAGMIALLAALDERVSLVRVGAWTVIALLLRQDNLLLVPAIILALTWRAHSSPARLVSWLLPVGAVTVLAYAGIWGGLALAGSDLGFVEWMWGVAEEDYSLVQRPALAHAVAFGSAVTGKQWPAAEPWMHIWVGVGALGLVLACAAFLRGGARWERLAALAGLITVLQFAFYAWFEPTNPEWTLFTFTLAAAVAARAANGAPTRPLPVRQAGAALLFIAACATWVAHGDYTLSFRDHRYEAAGRWVAENTKKEWRHFGYQNRGVLAVETQRIKCEPLYTAFDRAYQHLLEVVAEEPATPLLAVVDLGIQTGMPYDMRELAQRWPSLESPEPPRVRILWKKGGVYVVGFLVPE